MGFINKLRSSMSMNVLGYIITLTFIFGVVVCIIGNSTITNAYKKEYTKATYHMADGAAVFVDGNHIDDYLAGKRKAEYGKSLRELQLVCEKLNVSLVYVIKVDEKDYSGFTSVFNAVNNSVDDSKYVPWEIGHKQKVSGDEYIEKYKKLYNKKSKSETIFVMHPKGEIHPHLTTMVPVENDAGKVTGILCIQRPVREMADAMMPYLLRILLGVLLMQILVCVLAVRFINKAIITPVNAVSEEAHRFAKENAKGEPLGKISKYDSLQTLADSIDTMETDMLEYVENIREITAKTERIESELSIAKTIQADALPDLPTLFKNREDFEIYATMTPAREVGGDFYNGFFVDDDHLALVMADVSGKGIPAALFMMVSNIMINEITLKVDSPARILATVNEGICQHNKADMFVTVWLGILELSTGRLIYANAGHEDPVLYRKGGEFELKKEKHGFVIGGMEGMKYKDWETQLQQGDKLFLYTDGVPEATNANEEMFGLDRMVDALNEHKEQSPEEILKGVEGRVDEFVGEASQFDDLTMLCVELK